jgi:hypothetical protein
MNKMKKQNTILTFPFLLLTIFSVSSVCSAAKNQLVRRILGEGGSIKMSKLCETKPIFEMPKMIVTVVYIMTNNKKQRTMNYQKQSQTKPNQTQSNPISKNPKMNLNHYKTKEYENKSAPLTMQKQTQTNPIQTQNKPNSKPIQIQTKPKQTQSNPIFKGNQLCFFVAI